MARTCALAFCAALLGLVAGPLAAATASGYDAPRRAMVANIEQLAASGAPGGQRRLDLKVLTVMREVPRERFVPEALRGRAYDDTPLPLGYGSTISQPFIVAVMTDLLDVKPGQKVLEVGAGSGYQAAILSRLGARVYTIEIVPQLAHSAADRLKTLGYTNVEVRSGDGYKGWPEQAPFDAILVTAGATHIPGPLLQQLKPGGRMLIPMGPDGASQELTLVTRGADGRATVRRLGGVRFVPLDERARPTR